jgi:hypothetical protein
MEAAWPVQQPQPHARYVPSQLGAPPALGPPPIAGMPAAGSPPDALPPAASPPEAGLPPNATEPPAPAAALTLPPLLVFAVPADATAPVLDPPMSSSASDAWRSALPQASSQHSAQATAPPARRHMPRA